jgi:hypothetical protein
MPISAGRGSSNYSVNIPGPAEEIKHSSTPLLAQGSEKCPRRAYTRATEGIHYGYLPITGSVEGHRQGIGSCPHATIIELTPTVVSRGSFVLHQFRNSQVITT